MKRFLNLMIAMLMLEIFPGVITAAEDGSADLVKSLYGDRIAKVTATPSRVDDVALAKELLDGARTTKDNLGVLTAMCEAAHELGMRHRDGYAIAVEALELLAASDLPDTRTVNLKLLETYQKYLTVADKENKTKLTNLTLSLLDELIRQSIAKRDYTDASSLIRRAIAVAGSVNNQGRVADFKLRLNGVTEFERVQRRILALSERVLENANDHAAVEEVVRLMIVDMDDPASAVPYVTRLMDGPFKQMATLAIKPADELDNAQRLELGEWFHSLATQQKPSPAYAWLRAEEHLQTFLDNHTTADLARTKATLKLNEVQQALSKGAAENVMGLAARKVEPMIIISARFGTGGKWLDCTQRFKSFVFNNTIIAWVDSSWCGGDPSPGWNKKLHLRYRVGEKIVDRWFETKSRVLIYEGPEPRPTDSLTILSACFGRTDEFIDVTYQAKRSVRKNRLDITVIPREWNVRDLHPDKTDSLFIVYAVKGKLMVATAGENGKISIPASE